MAYETGTATDVTDLLSKLRTFANANGWSENYYGARTTGSGNAYQANKGGVYVTFRTDTTSAGSGDPGPYIGAYGHGTYVGGNGTESQAGASVMVMTNAMSGPFAAYHFISNNEKGAEYLYCIVETSSGIFKHFGAGTLVKLGAISNGQFVYASRWKYTSTEIDNPGSGHHSVPFDTSELAGTRSAASLNVRADADSISPRWMDGSYSPTIANRSMRGGFRLATSSNSGGSHILQNNAASALTGRNSFFPFFLIAERSGGLFNPLGYPPGVRFCNMTYLDANATVTIGSDSWKVFPVIRKNGGAGQVNSGTYGYAFKVN